MITIDSAVLAALAALFGVVCAVLGAAAAWGRHSANATTLKEAVTELRATVATLRGEVSALREELAEMRGEARGATGRHGAVRP